MNDDVRFNVSFYDDSHKRALRDISVYRDLLKTTESGIVIPYGEFISYAIFNQQSADPGYSSFRELQNEVRNFLPAYESYYQHSGNTIFLKRTAARHPGRPQTEMGGVGAALSIASRVYGLTEADWQRIPESRDKTLDFMRSNPRLASNGEAFIQVEAKGHASDRPELKRNLANDVTDVAEKKQEQRKVLGQASEFLGIITVFPTSASDSPQIWIADPPVIPIVGDPRKLRLLKRLYFYWKAVSPISGWRGRSALINRIYAIARTAAFESFDMEPLLSQTGDPIESEGVERNTTHITSLDAFGEILGLRDDLFYFYGLDTSIIGMLERQNFREILAYSMAGGSIRREVRLTAVVKRRNVELLRGWRFRKAKVELSAAGVMHTSLAGRVFGRIRFDEDDLERKIAPLR